MQTEKLVLIVSGIDCDYSVILKKVELLSHIFCKIFNPRVYFLTHTITISSYALNNYFLIGRKAICF